MIASGKLRVGALAVSPAGSIEQSPRALRSDVPMVGSSTIGLAARSIRDRRPFALRLALFHHNGRTSPKIGKSSSFRTLSHRLIKFGDKAIRRPSPFYSFWMNRCLRADHPFPQILSSTILRVRVNALPGPSFPCIFCASAVLESAKSQLSGSQLI